MQTVQTVQTAWSWYADEEGCRYFLVRMFDASSHLADVLDDTVALPVREDGLPCNLVYQSHKSTVCYPRGLLPLQGLGDLRLSGDLHMRAIISAESIAKRFS